MSIKGEGVEISKTSEGKEEMMKKPTESAMAALGCNISLFVSRANLRGLKLVFKI